MMKNYSYTRNYTKTTTTTFVLVYYAGQRTYIVWIIYMWLWMTVHNETVVIPAYGNALAVHWWLAYYVNCSWYRSRHWNVGSKPWKTPQGCGATIFMSLSSTTVSYTHLLEAASVSSYNYVLLFQSSSMFRKFTEVGKQRFPPPRARVCVYNTLSCDIGCFTKFLCSVNCRFVMAFLLYDSEYMCVFECACVHAN